MDRLQFLAELRELVYGRPSEHVKERIHLHKIVENHTWIFGEQFHLMGSDTSITHLLPIIRKEIRDVTDDQDAIMNIESDLRDIPDLYLMNTKWNDGAKFFDHLVVELKRPSVRIVSRHIEQLKRYAGQIVRHSMFGQLGHRFTFVLVSSSISQQVKDIDYHTGSEPGLVGTPPGLGHPTELWALQWSDYLDRRRKELTFLREKMQVMADPEALDYLRRTVGSFLPSEVLGPSA